MAAGPLFVVIEKNVKPSHGTQEKGLKCTEKYTKKVFFTTLQVGRVFFVCENNNYFLHILRRNVDPILYGLISSCQ